MATFYYPQGNVIDLSGNLYIADTNNHTIRKITPTGFVTTFAGVARQSGSEDGPGMTARFNEPRGITIDRFGNLYVTDTNNHSIRKITPFGVVTTFAGARASTPKTEMRSGSKDGQSLEARFYYPHGITIDQADNIYVADTMNNSIRKITSIGTVTTLAGSARNLCDCQNGQGSTVCFHQPRGLTVDRWNNVYVADTHNHVIRKITPDGVVTTFAGVGRQRGYDDGEGLQARFKDPEDITIDQQGNLYVTDTGNSTIRKITPTGTVTTFAGFSEAYGMPIWEYRGPRFHGPTGITIDSSGNFYISDTGNHVIRKISETGHATIFAGTIDVKGSNDDPVPLEPQYFEPLAKAEFLARKRHLREFQHVRNTMMENTLMGKHDIEQQEQNKLLINECPICLYGFPIRNRDVRFLPCCRQPIHLSCTIPMGRRFMCPLCRTRNVCIS